MKKIITTTRLPLEKPATKRSSPIPRLFTMILLSVFTGVYSFYYPDMPVFIWAFGFSVGCVITAIILKW